ncbi:MAG: hypothetical protein AVDCRST_MAG01-01-3643, partial [uncultured Rubrobacteraceae bacterium]
DEDPRPVPAPPLRPDGRSSGRVQPRDEPVRGPPGRLVRRLLAVSPGRDRAPVPRSGRGRRGPPVLV